MSIGKSLKDAMLTGAGLVSWQNNAPTQYNDRQHQYFGAESRTFTQAYAKYSSDFIEAQMQGIDPDDPYAYQTRLIRMADIVKPTAAIQRNFDDYKTILVADRDIEYLMPGSKVVAMGSTWLVFNPLNVSGSDGSAVVRRCNAVWNHLDYYGNVVSEPIVVENQRANANDSDAQNSQLISKGYFNVMCQYNDDTRQIDTNTRIILGTAAYRVTGYSDFEMEYTGDYNSVRLLKFTVRYEEPNDAIDDMVNHVAGGKTFAWDIGIDGPSLLRAGETAQFIATSVRNNAAGGIVGVSGSLLYAPPQWSGEDDSFFAEGAFVSGKSLVVPGSLASYLWSSSDETVLAVDETGFVTALAEGSAQITATLEQNPAYSCTIEVTVTETADGVQFITTVPDAISAYQSVEIKAAYFEDGAETDEPLVWELTGADENAYSYMVPNGGKSISIDCFGYSATPLTVTASYSTYSVSAEIELGGI